MIHSKDDMRKAWETAIAIVPTFNGVTPSFEEWYNENYPIKSSKLKTILIANAKLSEIRSALNVISYTDSDMYTMELIQTK
jgi:hypothetical protein